MNIFLNFIFKSPLCYLQSHSPLIHNTWHPLICSPSLYMHLIRNVIQMEAYRMQPFETGFFHSACLRYSSKLLCVSIAYFFLLHGCSTIYPFTIPSFWRLVTQLLKAFTCRFLCEDKFSFLLGKYVLIGVGLTDQVVQYMLNDYISVTEIQIKYGSHHS